jgi:hypothetical protein
MNVAARCWCTRWSSGARLMELSREECSNLVLVVIDVVVLRDYVGVQTRADETRYQHCGAFPAVHDNKRACATRQDRGLFQIPMLGSFQRTALA